MPKIQALVINCGSSSLKYGLFEVEGDNHLEELCSGLVDKIGLDGCVIKHECGDKSDKIQGMLKDHGAAMKKVVEILTAPGGPVTNKADIKVVGHRVVHGGPKFSQPTVVTPDVTQAIKDVIPLAPLHNPANIMGVEMAQANFSVPNVVVFDTAFHATMPPESYRYAVPKELYTEHSVRRYGFHGTSYKYVSSRTAEIMGRPLSGLNLIICHLGNGCSMACLKDGKVVDTTMGLTPLEGLMMGTRCGDIDAGVYTFLCNHLKKTPAEVDTIFNKKSGLLGVAGTSDMRDVIEAGKKGNEDAKVARAMYVQRVRKYLGAFLVKLNGRLDALVFTAGVGENDRGFRELVCADLETLGLEVDSAKNQSLKGEGEISTPSSTSRVFVVPTQEELSIAQQSLEVLGLIKAPAAPAASTEGRRSSSSIVKVSKGQLLLGAAAVAAAAVVVDRALGRRN
eukprot:TRINITY_DN54145_c0_g1_i1.p1 TRINITY_DN54145_c0_g1~~TRINITY_DN54145_c0_g1_i1.p1  ORF type:complete len:452 (-),score=120.52 TRINITY_DN54145_c0_g1_i1:222-1577(-)